MAEPIDYGQSLIAAFNSAAGSGQFHFDPAAVDQVVDKYDEFIDGAEKIKDHLKDAESRTGFGDIPSAKELQTGFQGKATEGLAVIDQLIDGAMRIQEAYLRAADRIADADSINQKRITMLTATISGQK